MSPYIGSSSSGIRRVGRSPSSAARELGEIHVNDLNEACMLLDISSCFTTTILPFTLALIGIIAGLGLTIILGVLLGPVYVRPSFRPPQYAL